MNSIYVHREGQQLGPWSEETVRLRLNAGEINGSDLAWHEGLEGWRELSSILGLAQPPPLPPPAESIEADSTNDIGSESTVQDHETPGLHGGFWFGENVACYISDDKREGEAGKRLPQLAVSHYMLELTEDLPGTTVDKTEL